MDWVNKEENSINQADNNFEDLFMKNSYSNIDYEIKIDDYILENDMLKIPLNKALFNLRKENKNYSNNLKYCNSNSLLSSDEINEYRDNISELKNVDVYSTVKDCNLSYNSFQNVNFKNMTLSERMKYKKEKAKSLLDRKTKRQKDFAFSVNLSDTCEATVETPLDLKQNLNKKEIKMLRNRISAQKSRDRKKKEFDELKKISMNVLNENRILRKQIKFRNLEIENMNEKLNQLCNNCSNIFKKEKLIITEERNSISNKLKYSIITGILAIVCILGTLTTPQSKRMLKQAEPNINNSQINTDLIVYPISNRKDIELFKTQTNYPTRNYNTEKFLAKKRLDFLIKIHNKMINEKFLNAETCPNTDNINTSIHEDNLFEDNNLILTYQNEIMKYNYDILNNDFYTNNFKSLYCNDMIGSEDKGKIFEDMFEKLNYREFEIKNKNDDCYYLHMIIPSDQISIIGNSLESENKKVFYEVGCKVFEINKINKKI